MSEDDARALTIGRAVLMLFEQLAPATPRATDLVPLSEAARLAATSLRVVRDAIRAGCLPAVGGQRDRAIRRQDLDAWIESRRVRPVAGFDDIDIVRRMKRLQGARGSR